MKRILLKHMCFTEQINEEETVLDGLNGLVCADIATQCQIASQN